MAVNVLSKYRSLSSSHCSFLHSPVTFSLLGPNTLLSTLFSNSLNLRFSLSVSDQVSLPYRNIRMLVVLKHVCNVYSFDGYLVNVLICTDNCAFYGEFNWPFMLLTKHGRTDFYVTIYQPTLVHGTVYIKSRSIFRSDALQCLQTPYSGSQV